jgi:hypothetical protein
VAPITENHSLRSTCAAVRTWDDYFALRQSIVRTWTQERLWDCLWDILLDFQEEESDTIAGYLLIDIEPSPRLSCEELLNRIADSHWYLSNREVPFYLVARFGKEHLSSVLNKKLSSATLTNDQRIMLEGIQYWVSMPASTLSDRFHYFEWQEAIERDNA